MPQRKTRFIILLLSFVVFSLAGCRETSSLSSEEITTEVNEELPSEQIKEGAYLITSESWETYVRSWAASIEHLLGEVTEDFIEKALDESLTVEDVDGLSLYPPSRKAMWIVVRGENLTLSLVERKVYSFALQGDTYHGEALFSSITFKLNNDLLTLETNNHKLTYFFDRSYVFGEEPVQLAKPEIDEYTIGGEELNIAFFSWNYESSYGAFGAGILVKKAGENEFSLVKIEYPYYNSFHVEVHSSDLHEGTNVVRIKNLGGATLTYSSPQIVTYLESSYETFNIVVASDFTLTIEKQRVA